MRKTFWALGLGLALALAACGGGGSSGGGAGGGGGSTGGGGGGGGGGGASCSPSGTTINVVASGFAFDKACYAVPAGQAFTVDFDNKDSAPHTFSVYTDSSATKSLFKTPAITSEQKTFKGKALQPGTYYFQCDIHTSMNGTFVVK